MQWLSSLLLAIQVLASLSIIVLVLLQQGKGADTGSSFGGGSAGSLFGAAGAANFLSRTTRWAAIIFFAATIGLAYNSYHTGNSILDGGLMQDYQSSAPAKPAGSAVPGSAVPGSAAPSAAVPQSAAPAAAPAGDTAPAATNEVPAAPSANAVPAPAAEAAKPESSVPASPSDTPASK